MKSTVHACGTLLVLCALGCSGSIREGAPHPDLTVITHEQLLDDNFLSLYDAVEAKHSNWLHARGPDSFRTPSQVLVYLDNIRLGGVESLRSIRPNTVFYLRHYDGIEATQRWGIGHSAGVIYVSTHPASGSDW